ncbi:hypothetical protein QLH48_05150 [Bacillus safensis]|uniref:hypothetical protein n=1 Tax=Bacillus TaxID=1386 RepID=UPI000F790CC9|nr:MULTISPECIES: hypothetical protein [Bacillus]MCM3365305.1 hypothetical protein [Bacillus safensis]MDJ0289829.1 hypothetical protein [Bacillus safensis]NMW01668.1 hypothetical protein [Bacillus safensis]
MSTLFRNHSIFARVLRDKDLPILKTFEFNFFRCVNVEDWVFGKNVSDLHKGNLRDNNGEGRHSRLFPHEKISYWADDTSTALAEIKKHGGNKNYLTFMAYDDKSSTFPTLNTNEDLVIIDGIQLEFDKILSKIERNEELMLDEKKLINLIEHRKPDCLAYKSKAKKGGINFLFFEKGFNKLSIKKVKLYFGEKRHKNHNTIICADTSDYTPYIESYGKFFEPIAKVKTDRNYKTTDEYKFRSENYSKSLTKIQNSVSV